MTLDELLTCLFDDAHYPAVDLLLFVSLEAFGERRRGLILKALGFSMSGVIRERFGGRAKSRFQRAFSQIRARPSQDGLHQYGTLPHPRSLPAGLLQFAL
jgi:hypothetical protein